MKTWLRRIGYSLIFLLWLIGMSLPIVMFMLGARGELQLGSNPQSHLRLFLVREGETEGVGVEWARRVPNQPECSYTTVSYWVWAGKSQETVRFCQCFDENGNLVENSCDG